MEFLLWLRNATEAEDPSGAPIEWEQAVSLALAGPAKEP